MSTAAEKTIESVSRQISDPAARTEMLDALERTLLDQKDYHRLFDARCRGLQPP